MPSIVVTNISLPSKGCRLVISPFDTLCFHTTLPDALSNVTVVPDCVGTKTILFFSTIAVGQISYHGDTSLFQPACILSADVEMPYTFRSIVFTNITAPIAKITLSRKKKLPLTGSSVLYHSVGNEFIN